MANNIQALIDLLGESILDVDLSFISSRAIVQGDLQHIHKFLEVILEVIVHIAQEQGEGEEEEDEESKASPIKGEPIKKEVKEEIKSASGKKPKLEELPDFYGESQPESKQVMVDDDLVD